MRDERFNAYHGSESESDHLIEAKDNVVDIKTKEKPVEHAIEHIMGEVGTHEHSLYLLGELGYSNLDDARSALVELRSDKEQLLEKLNKYVRFSVVGKLKDKVFNQGIEVKKLIELESKMKMLQRAIRFTEATESQKRAGEVGSQEFKKAA